MSIVTTPPTGREWSVHVTRHGKVIAKWAVATPGEATALAAVAAEFWPGLVCRVVRPGSQTAAPGDGPVRQTSTADQIRRPRQTGPVFAAEQTGSRTDRQTTPDGLAAAIADQTDLKGDQ